jgi:hypothetical protein
MEFPASSALRITRVVLAEEHFHTRPGSLGRGQVVGVNALRS